MRTSEPAPTRSAPPSSPSPVGPDPQTVELLTMGHATVYADPRATILLVTLSGNITFMTSGWLTTSLATLVGQIPPGADDTASARGEAGGWLLLDLSEVAFLDASGITALVRTLLRARARHVGFELAGAHGPVARVLRLTSVDSVLTLHPSSEHALAALTHRASVPPPAAGSTDQATHAPH